MSIIDKIRLEDFLKFRRTIIFADISSNDDIHNYYNYRLIVKADIVFYVLTINMMIREDSVDI